jgi:hypothetical protein
LNITQNISVYCLESCYLFKNISNTHTKFKILNFYVLCKYLFVFHPICQAALLVKKATKKQISF